MQTGRSYRHRFRPPESQLHGYPGHPEIELALMRLYDALLRSHAT